MSWTWRQVFLPQALSTESSCLAWTHDLVQALEIQE